MGNRIRNSVLVVLFAAAVYLVSCASPPNLMDDVDSVQAQIARNMLESGDWVTARLDGVKYLEKSPMVYWMMASSFAVFGVHDWAARLPIALCILALCWLVYLMGEWAFGEKGGLYSGLALSSCVGLFLFTRILIPDVILTGTIALSMWAFLRALDEDEENPRLWAALMAAGIAVGLLLKGLIAALFPVAGAGVYLLVTRQVFVKRTWEKLHVWSGMGIILLIAAPWHVLATIQNPPYFDWTMKSEPGHYRGFFWFYFFNEHVFRFLNIRFPRDYNTVPRPLFWLFHLLWLFPFSVLFPAAGRLGYKPVDRAGRLRLLALCWTGFLLTFFTFSTTQEYYSMPCYPALALLLGSAAAGSDKWARVGTKFVCGIAIAAAVAIGAILYAVQGVPTPGDISKALTQNPDAYTLSLGHMGDLTIQSFAYLRVPLVMALVAFLIGAAATFRFSERRTYLGMAAMMVLFLLAARTALVTFDPYLGSRELANALLRAPQGQLIVDDQYYTFSSVFFYTNRRALLLNGRVNNLEYGSNAPDAPDVFIDDGKLRSIWPSADRYYLVAERPAVARLEQVLGKGALQVVAESGGKFLFTNHADLH